MKCAARRPKADAQRAEGERRRAPAKTLRAVLGTRDRRRGAPRAAGVAAALRDQPGGGDVRWVREESLHVTLRFLGATDPARVADLEREGVRATRGIAPFPVPLAGAVLFPSARRARVVALALAPEAELGALAARRSSAARSPRASRPSRARSART